MSELLLPKHFLLPASVALTLETFDQPWLIRKKHNIRLPACYTPKSRRHNLQCRKKKKTKKKNRKNLLFATFSSFLPPTLTPSSLKFRDYQSKWVHLSTPLKVNISNTFRAGIVIIAETKLGHPSPHLL